MTIKRAEDTIYVADVRVVRARINYERNLWLWIFSKTNFVRQSTEVEQFGVLQKEESFFGGEAFLVLDFLIER